MGQKIISQIWGRRLNWIHYTSHHACAWPLKCQATHISLIHLEVVILLLKKKLHPDKYSYCFISQPELWPVFIQHGDHARSSHGSLTAESPMLVQTFLSSSLRIIGRLQLGRGSESYVILSSWEGTWGVGYAMFFFLFEILHWSNLTFGLWASWGAPNVPHFLKTWESQSCFTQLFFTAKMSREHHQKLFVFVPDQHRHKQWPLSKHSHSAGNENVSLSTSLFSLQRDGAQAGVGQNYNSNQTVLASLFLSGLLSFFGGGGRSDLITCQNNMVEKA